jgi:hypothetical protein
LERAASALLQEFFVFHERIFLLSGQTQALQDSAPKIRRKKLPTRWKKPGFFAGNGADAWGAAGDAASAG